MNTPQEIFVVFFAIFWGAVFNVQGRWKMFQPILSFPHIRHRFIFSFLLLNVVPVLFFAWTFFRLKDIPGETWLQISAGVLPAFAIFAFYRLWIGIVECSPSYFYQSNDKQDPDLKKIDDPTVESLNLEHPFKVWNFLLAALYLVIATVGPCMR